MFLRVGAEGWRYVLISERVLSKTAHRAVFEDRRLEVYNAPRGENSCFSPVPPLALFKSG